MNNVNPAGLLGLLQKGQNPQQLMMSILQNNMNPMAQNLLNLAKKGDSAAIEGVARNYLTSQGYDYDKEFNNFKQSLNL